MGRSLTCAMFSLSGQQYEGHYLWSLNIEVQQLFLEQIRQFLLEWHEHIYGNFKRGCKQQRERN